MITDKRIIELWNAASNAATSKPDWTYSEIIFATVRAVIAEHDAELRKQEPKAVWLQMSNETGFPSRVNSEAHLCAIKHPDFTVENLYLTPKPPHDEASLKALYAAPIPTVTPTTAVKEVWLCYAYGETEWPCVVIASNREQIRQFVIDEWLGDSDDEQLPEIMERIDAYDWKDGTLEWRFEIGGVKISKVYNAAPIPPDNHDWKAEYLRQVDLHNQTLDELREAEMQLRNPAPTPPTPSQQELKHPTYGTIENLMNEIVKDVKQGYEVRLGMLGAINWFSCKFGELRARPDEVTK